MTIPSNKVIKAKLEGIFLIDKNMIKSNYIVHDCETGGLDETKNPITQYAAVVLDYKTLKEVDRFETFVKPYNGLVIGQDALDHTMVSMSDINAGMSIKDFVATTTEFWETHRAKSKKKEMGRLISVGHNIPFDHRMLVYALNLQKKDFWEYVYENFIDTFPLAKLTFGLEGNEKINLGATCERAKIRLTDAHGAMNDVEANADLFRWFARKLRSKKGEGAVEAVQGRAKGVEFFEFKCGK